MSLTVVWELSGQEALKHLGSWRHAADVVTAVNRYAAALEGTVYVGDHLGDFRLVVGRYRVRFTVDLGLSILNVWDIRRTS